jgi:CheY-like chemotaxis protein
MQSRVLLIANPYESARIRRAVEQAGVAVDEVESEEAEAALRRLAPDVVIVSAAMVQEDGVALLNRLRALCGSAAAPRFILLGGGGGPVHSLEAARRHGADEFLERPVDTRIIAAKIREALRLPPLAARKGPDLMDVVAARVDAALEGALDHALQSVTTTAGAGRAPEEGTSRPAAPTPFQSSSGAETLPESSGAGSLAVEVEDAAAARSEPLASVRLFTPAELERGRARIAAQMALTREADYFAILGLRRDATVAEIRAAHEAASHEFSPAQLGQLSQERIEELRAIREVLEETRRVLLDDVVRTAYAAHLPPT